MIAGCSSLPAPAQVDGITGGVDCNTAFRDYPTRIREKGCNHLSKPTTGNPSTAKTGTCTGDGVRIRAEAHTAAKVLGSADKGDRLELLADDGWGLVQGQGQRRHRLDVQRLYQRLWP